MEKQALLLSSWYLPLRTVRWQLAIKLVYEQRVDTLAHYDEVISSPSVTWNIPAVIRYRRGARSGAPKVRFSRSNVLLRDGHTCLYCQRRLPSSQLTLDHVIPRSQGGQRSWENIVTACRPCNAKKANLSCDEAGMFPSRHPVIPHTLPVVARRFGLPQIPSQWLPFLEGWT
jgi:5-methylcytosine-specific restriction endonuclease McrA